MASYRLLIILGTCMMLPYSSFCSDNPTDSRYWIDENCRNSTVDRLRAIEKCINIEYTGEKVNETISMFNESKCPMCHHLCRKREQFSNCIKEGMKSLKQLSNRTIVMIPFLESLLEEGLTGVCENEAHMISAFGDEGNSYCYRGAVNTCQADFDFFDDLGEIFFCDPVKPKYDLNSSPFICQRLLKFLECLERNSTSCSAELKNALKIFLNLLRKSESCSTYYE